MQPEKLILFVDDEIQILRSLERILRNRGFNFVCESDVDKAFEILKTRKVALVVSDYRMPKMNGAEFLSAAKKISPNSVRMILSGYADQNVVLEAIKKGEVSQFITKPWKDEDLIERIQTALESIPEDKANDTNTNSPAVLILDDEKGVLSSLNRLLRLNGWKVSTFDQPNEALQALKNQDFSVFVSDYRMPNCTGVEILEKAKNIAPDTVRILLTGYADGQAAVDAINKCRIYKYLNKPWNEELLLNTLKEAAKIHTESKTTSVQRDQSTRRIDELNNLVEQQKSELTHLQSTLQTSGNLSVDLLRTTLRQFPTVSAHCERVAEMALRVGKELGLSQVELKELEAAARIHDIGEMGLADSVLNKDRAQLTAGEKKLLERHVTAGEELILKLHDGAALNKIIQSHHESFNGTGYPQGLKGDAIPLASRILTACDVYDQTLHANSIFDKTTPASVLKYIHSLSNQRLDAKVVRALTIIMEDSSIQKDNLLIRVRPENLTPGMVVARDLVTAQGRSVVKAGVTLDARNIQLLLKLHENDPLVNDVWVKRAA